MKRENEIRVSDELISKYIAGEADPDEAERLNDWLEQDDNRTHFENLQTTWHQAYPSKKTRSANKDKVWASLQSQIRTINEPQAKINSFKFLKFAATILALMVVGSTAFFLFKGYNFSKPISIQSGNQLLEMILTDNSHVVLNKNSQIAYNEFTGDSRTIHLSGEAFFNVTTDRSKPFIIHNRLADIQVVGTSFNVAEKKDRLEISVAEGTVLVLTKNDSAYITSGKIAIVYAASASIATSDFHDVNTWSYATHKFVFKNTTLGEVFDYLEKAFPYTIHVNAKSIENCRFTATIEEESADYIVSLIAETLDLSVTKTDHEFTLEGTGCE